MTKYVLYWAAFTVVLAVTMHSCAYAAEERIYPVCIDETDVNGKVYHSCKVIRPEENSRLVPVRPVTNNPVRAVETKHCVLLPWPPGMRMPGWVREYREAMGCT